MKWLHGLTSIMAKKTSNKEAMVSDRCSHCVFVLAHGAYVNMDDNGTGLDAAR